MERGEKESREEVSRALARVLRHEDVRKIWYTHKKLSTTLKEIRRFRNDDEGVLQTMIRDVGQDGAGTLKRERFVVKDHGDIFSCIAADGKKAAKRRSSSNTTKADGWSTEEEIGGGGSSARLGKSGSPGKADWWSSDWKSNWRSGGEELTGSKNSRKFVMGSQAGKGRDWSWQDARWGKAHMGVQRFSRTD